jgi:glutaredoxin
VKAEKESGVIKIRIKVGEQEFDSYVSLDGKYFFPSAFEVGKNPEEIAQNDQNQPSEENAVKSCEDVPKNDSPLVEAFVVSNCPFGIQMQRILSEIVKNIPELKKYIKVEYLGSVENGKVSSMHGEDEAKENLRQICIREEQNDKYWDYVSCYIKNGDVEGCLKTAKVNSSKLDDCLKTKGIDYAKKDFSQQDKYGASGSPTLVLNGKEVSEFNFGGRTAEAVKTLLCCGFTKTPEFCNKKLSTSEAATSFSESYEGGNGSSQGSCGQ